ncbi:phosphate acyltransferase PlsX [Phycisphaerales bacterium AB-hyl4]|uniref:Phosphate acyltransferase n=1 Tax=Natronomicrosphaera hydrolytica TaxID=3242702 RepID=A0ABV4TZM2_9BACT
MRIAIDVMGGDHSPDAILAGSLDALELLSSDDRLVLIGDETIIREEMAERRLQDEPRVEVVGTSQVIEMAEPPVNALREKPDSSITRMAEAGGKRAGDKRCDVVISAGNTGACVAAAGKYLRRLPGVNRPGIAVTMPTFFGPVVICDVGANPEPRPHHLHQYAQMSAIYAQKLIELDTPRVALMSIGGEEGKGNALVRETHKLLKDDTSLNYVGYAEGRDIFDGKADVIVTEGFTGNVVLKLAEGLAAGLFRTIAHEIFEEDPDLAMKFEPIVKKIYKKHDYHEYGGAPLLGANGIMLICHGSSEARTITAAIRAGMKYAKLGINDAIVDAVSANEPASEEVA